MSDYYDFPLKQTKLELLFEGYLTTCLRLPFADQAPLYGRKRMLLKDKSIAHFSCIDYA